MKKALSLSPTPNTVDEEKRLKAVKVVLKKKKTTKKPKSRKKK